MKRAVKKYLSAALLPFLAACAGPKVTPLDAEIMQYQAAAVQACYAAETARRQVNGYADARDQALIPALRDLGLDLCDCEYFVRAALLPLPAPRPVVAQGNLHPCPTAAGPSSPYARRVG